MSCEEEQAARDILPPPPHHPPPPQPHPPLGAGADLVVTEKLPVRPPIVRILVVLLAYDAEEVCCICSISPLKTIQETLVYAHELTL